MNKPNSTINYPEVDDFAQRVLLQPQGDGQTLDLSLLRRRLREKDLPEREDQYFNFVGVSNSDMKNLAQHPKTFLEEKILEVDQEEMSSQYIKMGNLIETKLLCPAIFDDVFVQEPAEMKSPSSAKQKEFCQLVIEGDSPEEAFRQTYSTKRKSDEKIEEKAEEKYENLQDFIDLEKEIEKSEKTPYSSDEMMRVNNAILEAWDKENITNLLNPVDGDLKVQLPLCGTLEDVAGHSVLVKGLADFIIVEEDRIISVDLKTTSKPLSSFAYDYHKRRYYRQQGLYYHMLRQEFQRPVETKAFVMRTKEPFGSRVYDVPSSLIEAGIKEARALAKRLVLHLTEHGFEDFIEDAIPGNMGMEMQDNIIERNLNNARIQHGKRQKTVGA